MSTITPNHRAANVIRLKAPALADSVVAEHYRRRPELERRYGPLGRRRCLEDAVFHLHFLAGSVEFGDSRVFADYVAWAVDLLARRRIPADDVEENVRVMGGVLRDDLPPEAFELTRPHLEAALARVGPTGDHSPCHADGVSRSETRGGLNVPE
jgi:MerR family transcriptional regulator, light-induced transcriptional regulator